jgi:hypothetical protein
LQGFALFKNGVNSLMNRGITSWGHRAVLIAGTLSIAGLFTGCSSTSTTEQGAGFGALGGAAIGGAVGGWTGAAIGAGAGALGGAAVGAAKENADAKRETADRSYTYYDSYRDQYFYYDRDGNRIYI